MPPRLLAPLLATLLAFQSHWLDDIGTGAPDAAGMTVSGIASVLLLLGWWGWPHRAARLALGLAWGFAAWVSVADLLGLGADGRLAPSILEHWRGALGFPVAAAVVVALVAAAAGLSGLRAVHARTA
ncbi:MAG: hypothetical protein AB7P99_19460 [Vicinamibacterales bacterium]